MEQAYAELASTDSEGVMVFDDTPQPESFTAWIARRSRLEPDIAAKYAELRRMRRLAGGLLVGMTLAFVIATLGRSYSPALDYLSAFAEASMVGACADWFAVVALFRRPFGLPIPHTSIVPRNKERIGAARAASRQGLAVHPHQRRDRKRSGRRGDFCRLQVAAVA